MINFLNDYSEGCFPEIIERLSEINYRKTIGYGTDEFCAAAAEKIKKACGCEEAQVYFMAGGTQTNQMVADVLLDSFDGVVAVESGHVNTHEAGAIEYTGHKVLTLKGHDGKVDAEELDRYVTDYYNDGSYEHMVRPGMVYISHPTEVGTLYTRHELEELNRVCRKYNMPLYLDGARLAYGLTAEGTDVTLEDIARLTDVFYIGGTKCGTLFGEAIVWTKGNQPFRFNTKVKQHGAMLAKGWLAGEQFDVIFTPDEKGDTLYTKGGKNANKLADKLKDALASKGYRMYNSSPTNQVFVIVDNETMKKLSEKAVVGFFEKFDDEHTVIRFVTSWASAESDIDELINVL
ncbi:MAG: aminotransferase class I/II-fold pyridoxal phosphate-dependent enzyme [Parasporobacterium sp.]|nr:aminotransferase class I/II-fold pyridoxal phosphate-dependent enzyme [Parasporobacterium sp.]